MYDSNSMYDSNEYSIGNHNDFDLWNLRQCAQFNSLEICQEKNSDKISTGHDYNQIPHLAPPDQPRSTQNPPKIIECSNTKLFKIHKTKKGRTNETKNLVQFFRNQAISYLSILTQYQMLAPTNKSCSEKLQKFKQESTSVIRFYQLLAQTEIKHKLQEYFHSGDFLKKIMLSNRLCFDRKIQVVKNVHIMQKILWDSQAWNAGKEGKDGKEDEEGSGKRAGR